MRSRHHAPISALVGVALAGTAASTLPGPLVVGYATLAGTAIDLDHFLIARYRTGSWRHLRRCLVDPRMALLDQAEIFERGEVGAWTRLGTHAVLITTLTAVLVAVSPGLALVTAVVLVVHVGCDVAWDLWRRRTDTG